MRGGLPFRRGLAMVMSEREVAYVCGVGSQWTDGGGGAPCDREHNAWEIIREIK